MHDIDRALAEIASIRSQIADRTRFEGYGPATLAATGFIAALGAVLQAAALDAPLRAPLSYCAIWAGVALLSACLIATETVLRTRRRHGGLAQEMILQAFEQFAPAVAAGALLTLVVLRFVPDAMPLLPGLWQIVYALGLFASARFLPRPLLAVAGFYLVAGLITLALAGRGDGAAALSPWCMGPVFGLGQLAVAAILATDRRSP